MYSRLARTSLVALLGLYAMAGSAIAAEPKVIDKCSAAIIKAGGAFVQAEMKILQKCEDAKLKGKPCDQGKVTESIAKARTKLDGSITKACGGKDKNCATEDADGTQPTLVEIGWPTVCPNFEGKGCTNAIAHCGDIDDCLACVGEEAVEQAVALYYPPGRPSSVANKTLNKCQAALGKAGATFFAAKSKALGKCWGTKVKKPANCPADAQAAIDKARSKLVTSLAKPCLGQTNATIGLPGSCLAVKPESQPACNTTVDTLIDVGNCAVCVTEFKVDCPDRLAATSEGAAYPAECLIAPPTPTATATPVVTPTPTFTVGPTVTATPNPNCGNGQLDSGELCDTGSGSPQTNCPNVNTGAFPCNEFCTCDCPSTVTFTGDATDPASILDTGWTGISHRAPIITGGDVTVQLNCSTVGRPCGSCSVTGPIANPNAGDGQLDNQRCSNDSSIKCTNDTPCTAGGGTCEFYFGGPLPLAAGGVTTCVYNRFNGSVTGVANVESGEASTTALLTSTVYNGIAIDNPCPRCVGDGAANDGTAGGTCDGGTRSGSACDANGSIPNRDDFGRTSLDCPLASGAIIATLPINLTNETNPVTKTLTADSPNCGQAAMGQKCLCQTCNNVEATPCFTNADCTAVGATVCGGNRCIGGTNAGAPCNTGTPSQCPSGSCGRSGEPTKPSACLENSASPDNNLDCVDQGAGEGECVSGPLTSSCSVASGHAQRGCLADAECGDTPGSGAPGSCETTNRLCFLTGGGSFQAPQAGLIGSDTLIAAGMEDAPMNDVSNPTLGAVFCVGPTGAPAVNNVAGLPGPARVTIKGTAVGLP